MSADELVAAIDDLTTFVLTHDDRKRHKVGLSADLVSELLRKDARVFALAQKLGLPIPDVELHRQSLSSVRPRHCGFTKVPVVGYIDGPSILATSNWRSKLASLRAAAEALIVPTTPAHGDVESVFHLKREDQRPAYLRDHFFLKRSDEGAKPAAIRKEWNALSDAERKAICPLWPRKVADGAKGTETVETGIKKAKRERENR
jgi:hypothetical protein